MGLREYITEGKHAGYKKGFFLGVASTFIATFIMSGLNPLNWLSWLFQLQTGFANPMLFVFAGIAGAIINEKYLKS